MQMLPLAYNWINTTSLVHSVLEMGFSRQVLEPWSPIVEVDEQPYQPRQKATLSMKINIFGCKNIIS